MSKAKIHPAGDAILKANMSKSRRKQLTAQLTFYQTGVLHARLMVAKQRTRDH